MAIIRRKEKGGTEVALRDAGSFVEVRGALMSLPLSKIHTENRKPGVWSIITVVLVLVVGLCLFHFQHHGLSNSGMCPNPCSVVASLSVVALFLVLLVVSLLGPERVESLYLIPPRPLEIPPEVHAPI